MITFMAFTLFILVVGILVGILIAAVNPDDAKATKGFASRLADLIRKGIERLRK